MNEAYPVVTGRSDDDTANTVFPNWRTDKALQQLINPFLELEEAAYLRDSILHRFLLRPGNIVGVQQNTLRIDAQLALIRALIAERHWGRQPIESYLGIEFPDEVWAELYAEGVM
ncbi:hypothetical protein [Methylobacterium sp. WL120]|uniref:hypothetical protein n=1 Tax=Methylobacterium sp. WL120 TaxID=2603887 RepID=UPI0011C92BF8|nr:hypothetical protein [Methylobacterium sp. WL120]TXM69619.1 hypothetical protein FV229_04560 [Methylobacterium sp. WL120]